MGAILTKMKIINRDTQRYYLVDLLGWKHNVISQKVILWGIKIISPDRAATLDVWRFAEDANLHEFRGIDFSRTISE